jgi:hypothetical protein
MGPAITSVDPRRALHYGLYESHVDAIVDTVRDAGRHRRIRASASPQADDQRPPALVSPLPRQGSTTCPP